jgi:hypothetical protein
MTGKPGPVVPCSLDGPDTRTGGVFVRERKCPRVAARCRGHRPLRHDRARGRDHNREHVLVTVRVYTTT